MVSSMHSTDCLFLCSQTTSLKQHRHTHRMTVKRKQLDGGTIDCALTTYCRCLLAAANLMYRFRNRFTLLYVCVNTAVGELEGENAALMEVQLVLVRFGDVQDFHITAFHSHSQPLACRTVAQREDLEREERNHRMERK